mmetsp:Transcript_36252/g.78333  ORF Transcript_36252/g.78333 Transcript_36252/m.78333 type:complete len:217 (-) Transcript_36252:462-1112(-)
MTAFPPHTDDGIHALVAHHADVFSRGLLTPRCVIHRWLRFWHGRSKRVRVSPRGNVDVVREEVVRVPILLDFREPLQVPTKAALSDGDPFIARLDVHIPSSLQLALSNSLPHNPSELSNKRHFLVGLSLLGLRPAHNTVNLPHGVAVPKRRVVRPQIAYSATQVHELNGRLWRSVFVEVVYDGAGEALRKVILPKERRSRPMIVPTMWIPLVESSV